MFFKTIDQRLKEIGFEKTDEDNLSVSYKRYNKRFGYTHVVDILHKHSGRHILQSYDDSLYDQKNIGNTCVGLTAYELDLFLKKMKQLGWYKKGILNKKAINHYQ